MSARDVCFCTAGASLSFTPRFTRIPANFEAEFMATFTEMATVQTT